MREIFELNEGGTIAVRSSIISMSLIQNVIETEDVIKTMKEAFLSAKDKKQGKVYNELQKGLISHSTICLPDKYFKRFLDELEQRIHFVIFLQYKKSNPSNSMVTDESDLFKPNS